MIFFYLFKESLSRLFCSASSSNQKIAGDFWSYLNMKLVLINRLLVFLVQFLFWNERKEGTLLCTKTSVAIYMIISESWMQGSYGITHRCKYWPYFFPELGFISDIFPLVIRSPIVYRVCVCISMLNWNNPYWLREHLCSSRPQQKLVSRSQIQPIAKRAQH